MITWIRQGISDIITSFKKAKKTHQIPLWFVTAYAFYIPFEDYINSLIPIPPVRGLISFAPENVFYATAFFVLYHRFRFGGGIKKSPIDILVIALIISVLFSVFANGASPPGSFKNLRIHFRYIAVYYILINIDIPQSQIINILKKLKTLGIIQAVISSIQFFLPTGINLLLSAKACGTIIREKGANCGTFNDSAILAAFLLVTFILFCSSFYLNSTKLTPDTKQKIGILLLFIFAVFSSKKRASLMVTFLLPLVIFSFLKKPILLTKYIWSMATVGFLAGLVLSIIPSEPDPLAANQGQDLSSFSALFTEQYWKSNAESSRGWMIIVTMNALIKSGHIWFGFGPELGIVPRGIEQFLTDPKDVAQLQRNLYVFEDPYWFAILAYIGIVGLILFWWISIRLGGVAKYLMKFPLPKEEKIIILSLRTLIFVSFLYCFAERLFTLRTFSFYFWLFAGIMVNRYNLRFVKSSEKTMVL